MSQAHDNLLLESLPVAAREPMQRAMTRRALPLGTVLHEPGQRADTCYFPVDCIISLLYELQDGNSAEVAIVGKDGMIGLPVYMADGRSPYHAVVQAAGEVLVLKQGDLRKLVAHHESINHMLLSYSQALNVQTAQTAVCNRHHSVAQQLCRWLLMSIDRLPGDQLSMTQELIAHMLGVRRAGVTEVAGKLQREGLISYQRGRITVLDRERLQERCCECYQVVRDEYERLLPLPPSD